MPDCAHFQPSSARAAIRSRPCRHIVCSFAAAVLAAWLAVPATAQFDGDFDGPIFFPGQIFGTQSSAAGEEGDGSPGNFKPYFQMSTQTNEIKDALEEFQRFVEHESWDRAFQRLESIAPKMSTGYIDRGDKVMIPSRMLVRSLLAGLPSAGKKAFRVFYDPQANQLWSEAQGKDELTNLSKIVDQFMICSIADRAADRLGDLYYERGEPEQSLIAWKAILAYCPDTEIPRAQTLYKVCAALANAERWTEFHEMEKVLADRFASAQIQLAGQRVPAGKALQQLAERENPAKRFSAADMGRDFALPTSDEPHWHFPLNNPASGMNPNDAAMRGIAVVTDIHGRMINNDYQIPLAVDDQRVYVEMLGIAMAIDLDSGKLLWRSSKPQATPAPNQNRPQNRQIAPPERFNLQLAGDRLWSVTRDPQQQISQPLLYSLVSRDPTTGKTIFSSRTASALSSWNFLGAPLVMGDTIYACAARNSRGSELVLLSLDAKTGALQKTTTLGSYPVDLNQMMGERVAEPTFLAHRDRLYINTNGGAVLAVQPQAGLIEWGLLYETPPMQQNYVNEFGLKPEIAPPVMAGGLLFTKGMLTSRLLGVAVDRPTAVWNRPVPAMSVLVGADNERVYMGGGELSAIDLKSQELVWSTALPPTVGWSTPLVTEKYLYQFTSRGIHQIDKKTGNIVATRRGADKGSRGGRIFRTAQFLVTVSNNQITAYRLGSSAPAGTADEKSASKTNN